MVAILLSGSIVESSQPLSPPLLLKLVVDFDGDRPVALCPFFPCPFFPIAYLFQSWLLHVCSWFGKDGMKKVRFHASSCEKWKNTMNSPFLTYKYPHFLPSSREVEGVRDQSWQGQKWPCSSSRIARIRPCRKSESTISWEGELSGFSFPCRSQHIVMSARLWGERCLSGIKKRSNIRWVMANPGPGWLVTMVDLYFFNVRDLWLLEPHT